MSWLTDICTRLWCSAECHLPNTKRVLMENTDFQLRAIIPLWVTAKQLVSVFYKDRRSTKMTVSIFYCKRFLTTQYSKLKTVYFLLPLSIWYFVLFQTCIYSPRAKGDNPWGPFFFMEAERSYHFDNWLHVSKLPLPSDFMHIFSWFYTCI